MTLRRMLAAAGVVALVPIVVTIGAASPAYAHGSMQFPISRGYGCYLDDPENPARAACRAVVAAEGTAGLYDWMVENNPDANGRSRDIIPDGKLCSANSAEFRGLDLGRTDWPTTSMVAGSKVKLRYAGTGPHPGTFQVYLTHRGYDPTIPLRWSDLQAKPFLTVTDPPLVNGVYQMPARLPAGITGRNLIYTVWQRSDSPEAFYSCSDVVLTGGSGSGGATPVTGPAAPVVPTRPTTRPKPSAHPSMSPGMHMPSIGPAGGFPGGVSTAGATAPVAGSDGALLAWAATSVLAIGIAILYIGRRRWFGAHRAGLQTRWALRGRDGG
jgi:chitin-binding protein